MSIRRPTMNDVAERAGVSRALVSIVMRDVPGAGDSTRERVRAAARELGYVPDASARRLSRGARSGRNGLIGVVFGVGQGFHQDLLESFYAGTGREITLSGVTATRDEEAAVEALLRERCEGVVLLGGAATRQATARMGARVPLVTVLRDTRASGVSGVVTDEAAGVRQAVDHLVGLGHRRIAHVHGGRAAGAVLRRRAHEQVMAAHGLPVPRPIAGGSSEADGARAAEEIIRGGADRPTAVTVFNDRCALGLVDALRRHGLAVPDDVSVIGFDDIRAAGYAHIALTTIRQDAPRLVEAAMAAVDERVTDASAPTRHVVVPPSLVIRSTTGSCSESSTVGVQR